MRVRPQIRCASRSAALACFVVFAIASSRSSIASAQARGWAFGRLEPSVAGDPFFVAQSPTYTRMGNFAARAAIVVDYANQPLVVRTTVAGNPVAVFEHVLLAHALAQFQFLQRVGLDVALPLSLLQTGTASPGLPGVAPSNRIAAGDLRIGARVRVVGFSDRDPASLHVGLALHLGFLGYSAREQNVTDDAVRARAFVTGTGRAGVVRWSVTAGFHARPQTTLPLSLDGQSTTVGSEIYGSLGLQFVFAGDRFAFGPELWGATNIAQPFQPLNRHAEALLGITARPIPWLELGLAGGTGLTIAAGTPAFRGIFRVAVMTDGVSTAPERTREISGSAPADAAWGPRATTPTDLAARRTTATGDAPATTSPTGAATAAPASVPLDDDADPDSDGVRNSVDRCPTQPRGTNPDPDRPGCPDLDRDGDGVTDHADLCASLAAGAVPDPERRGCPLIDQDGDRVADSQDHCPTQPGTPSTDPTRNGCPGLAIVEATRIRITQQVHFAPARDRILPDSEPLLRAVVDAIRAQTSIRVVSVDGHTDDVGNEEVNIDLSQRRALQVMLWLNAHGVDADRLEYRGFGPTRPERPTTGLRRRALRDARSANRRVEFRVLIAPSQSGVGSAPPTVAPGPSASTAPRDTP